MSPLFCVRRTEKEMSHITLLLITAGIIVTVIALLSLKRKEPEGPENLWTVQLLNSLAAGIHSFEYWQNNHPEYHPEHVFGGKISGIQVQINNSIGRNHSAIKIGKRWIPLVLITKCRVRQMIENELVRRQEINDRRHIQNIKVICGKSK